MSPVTRILNTFPLKPTKVRLRPYETWSKYECIVCSKGFHVPASMWAHFSIQHPNWLDGNNNAFSQEKHWPRPLQFKCRHLSSVETTSHFLEPMGGRVCPTPCLNYHLVDVQVPYTPNVKRRRRGGGRTTDEERIDALINSLLGIENPFFAWNLNIFPSLFLAPFTRCISIIRRQSRVDLRLTPMNLTELSANSLPCGLSQRREKPGTAELAIAVIRNLISDQWLANMHKESTRLSSL